MTERDDSERTEEATPRRREEARKKGDVAKSREIPAVFLILFSLLYFYLARSYYLKTFDEMFRYFFRFAAYKELDYRIYLSAVSFTARLLLPLFLLLVAVSVFSYVVQFGFLFTAEPLVPKLDKLNPVKGIANLFSKRALVELLKAVFKVVVIFYIAYSFIKAQVAQVDFIYQLEPSIYFTTLSRTSAVLIFKIAVVFVFLSLLDYAFQKWEYEQNLKMTKQEVKEELKQQEGDPLVKSRIRRIQREMARKRMMQEVPKADVVITNPVEIAVALKYDEKSMQAPKVVAKGAGVLAAKIKEIARRHGVPIVENRALARMLYKMVDVGEEIPESLYKAVAEVLAFVYRQRERV